ncbi:MAG: fibronectin type III domain-containing protein [Lachnospiraceae bacterium]|nr:fibronectin type III domain-containing protein [Lachnospiraceae bacterium]
MKTVTLNKRLLFFLSSIILVMAFSIITHAEESNPYADAIALTEGQSLDGSFDGTSSAHTYYKIVLTKKQAITVYGYNEGNSAISLSLDDDNGNYVDHQSSAISKNSKYMWRTDELVAGTYYLDVSCHFAKNTYTVAYTSDYFPFYTDLPIDQVTNAESGAVYYKITVSEATPITVYGDQTPGDYVSLYLYDDAGKSVEHQSSVSTNSPTYKWVTKSLSPGTYYLEASCRKQYTIAYSTSPFPLAIALDYGVQAQGSLTSAHTSNTYKLTVTAAQSITISVSKNYGAYVNLELYNSNNKSVDFLSTMVKDASFNWSPDEALSPGTYYLVVSRSSDDINYTIAWHTKGPDAVKSLKMSKSAAKNVTLKWSAPSGASQYDVYKYDTGSKTFKKYKTVSATSCKITGLKQAAKYTFRVVPIAISGSERLEGEPADIKCSTSPAKAKKPKCKFYSSTTISGIKVNYYKISWKKVKGASGYQVYLKAKGHGGWKKAGSTKSRTCLIYVLKGYTAQVKVRAYINTDDATSYGAFSKVNTFRSN